MDKPQWRSLPAPFGQVQVQVEHYLAYVAVLYIGLPGDLLACGAIEDGMQDPGTKGKKRYDSYGQRFWRDLRPLGRLQIRQRINDMDRALTMPGVTVDDLDRDLVWLRKNPDSVHSESNEWRASWFGSKHALLKKGFSPALFSGSLPRGLRLIEGMHGIFAIEQEKSEHPDDPRCDNQYRQHESNVIPIRSRRPTPLHLVWSNPAMA